MMVFFEMPDRRSINHRTIYYISYGKSHVEKQCEQAKIGMYREMMSEKKKHQSRSSSAAIGKKRLATCKNRTLDKLKNIKN